jgi:peptide/nickel transport system ATP-binding protein
MRGSTPACELPETPAPPLLDVRDLHVSFRTEDGFVRAVDGVSFTVNPREIVGIVGESGSGKSVTAMAIMRLIRDPNAILTGQVLYRGTNLFQLSAGQMREVRGSEIAMVFQDPMTSLTPVYRVGWQIAEQIRAHERISRSAANRRAVELLASVGIPRPEVRVHDFPHQFSGGMRQRVMIAMALSCNPSVLSAANSRSRPTRGDSRRRAAWGVGATSTRFHAATDSDFPLT